MIIPLPCPFCGKSPTLLPKEGVCGCVDWNCAGHVRKLVEEWNKRFTPELDTAFDQFKASLEAERQRGDECFEMCQFLYNVNIKMSGSRNEVIANLDERTEKTALNAFLALEKIVKKYEV